jgi:hypothetical protein
MKSAIVPVFVFPATSLATPSATENLATPAVPPAPVALAATKLIDEIAEFVNAVVVIAQPADSTFFEISEINSPLTLSLKVTVIVADTVGILGVAVKLPPDTTLLELNLTVGRVASITTLESAAEAAVVVPPNV